MYIHTYIHTHLSSLLVETYEKHSSIAKGITPGCSSVPCMVWVFPVLVCP